MQLQHRLGELHVPAAHATALGDQVRVARALQFALEVRPVATHAHLRVRRILRQIAVLLTVFLVVALLFPERF